MKTRMMLAIALGLVATGASCKKKKDEPKTDPGAMKPNEGSATPTPTPTPEPPKATPKTGKDLAQVYIDCGKQMDAGKYEDFMKACGTDSFVAHMAGMPDSNAQQSMEMMKGFKAAFPDLKNEPQLVLVSGRNVYAVILTTGTHTGPLKMPPMPEVPATNKKMGQLFFHKLAINEENKATEEWGFVDPTTMMGQLGLVPKEAGPTRPAIDKGWEGAPIIAVAEDNEKEKKNLEVIKGAIAAMNAHKAADAVAFFADDGLESDQADSQDHKGKKEIQKGTEMFIKAFPDLKITETAAVTAGDYGVLIGTFEGTNKGPLGPMKATNKPVKGDFAEVMEFKDGKIVKLWRFRNGMDMATQLGLMPDPSKAGAPPAGDPKKGGDMKKDAKKGDKT